MNSSMNEEQELEQFNEDHPHPDVVGIESLFKFSKFDGNKIEHIEDLFVKGKLYTSIPKHFNDPFECKPNFIWPNNPSKVQRIRKHLIKVAIKHGHKRKSAEALISKNMSKPGFLNEIIYNSLQHTYSETRICSLTTNKENLLFWSHYADSHRGFCVEYNSTVLPISYAFKVQYKDEYPTLIYPSPPSSLGLKPVLIKSKSWEYEEEYRIVFVPEAQRAPKNDGEFLILSGNEIKNVYLGVGMGEENKRILIDLITKGPFNPRIWDVSLSKSSFKLMFNERNKVD